MHDLFPGQGTAALLEVFFQGDAVDILHHDILQLVGHRNIVHLDDVGMIQDGDGLAFVLETADQFLIAQEFFFQDLDRDLVAGADVPAFVDVGHAAHTDQAFDKITAVQFFTNQVIHLYPPLIDPYFPLPTAGR